jgi:hypothetical protein
MVRKFLDSMDKDELFDDVVEKKALPELVLKQNILNAQDTLLISERVLMNNRRTYGRYFRQDVNIFAGNIVLVFSFIKYMVLDKGLKNEKDQNVFKKIIQLEKGNDFEVKDLLIFKNFILKYLHLLNLTNLLQTGGKSFKAKFDEEY